jgi:hypothetical protein
MFRLIGALLLLAGPISVEAQTVELTPFVAYRVGGEFAGYSVNDNASYGGTLAVDLAKGVGPGVGIEFLYSHQGSDVTADFPTAFQSAEMKIDEWALLGWREVLPSGESKARPYGEVGAALTHFYTSGGGSSTRFSVPFGLGVKVFPSPKVGVNLVSRAYLTFVSSGSGGFYCNPGCSVGYSGSLFFQADLAAGITVKFGRTHEGAEPY